jgi:hypothetical protein
MLLGGIVGFCCNGLVWSGVCTTSNYTIDFVRLILLSLLLRVLVCVAMIADCLWPEWHPWNFRRMIGIGYRKAN